MLCFDFASLELSEREEDCPENCGDSLSAAFKSQDLRTLALSLTVKRGGFDFQSCAVESRFGVGCIWFVLGLVINLAI